MVSDSITTAPIPSAANSKNLSKKKRANRSAKLKQYKIDARREQWLSQGAVKDKGCKDGRVDGHRPTVSARKQTSPSMVKWEMRTAGGEDDGSIHHDSHLESPSNSPTSFNSSVLDGNDSGTNFTVSSSGSSAGSSISSSSSSGGCCSGNITEEEDGDDGCLDDWEAVADALAANDKHKNPCLESPPAHETVLQMAPPCEVTNESNLGAQTSETKSAKLVSRAWGNSRAWRPDDAFRPQNLPNLSKQYSLPNPRRHYGGGVPWACAAVPSSCPICCEDLDYTDASFLPCLCGFRLCLFCYKRILEDNGRCPGCRNPYKPEPVETETSVHGGSLTFQLARSCSMIERS